MVRISPLPPSLWYDKHINLTDDRDSNACAPAAAEVTAVTIAVCAVFTVSMSHGRALRLSLAKQDQRLHGVTW